MQYEEDIFNSTFLTHNKNKAMRKNISVFLSNDNNCQSHNNIQNNSSMNMMSPKTGEESAQKSSKHVYLFYRTPSNKENKKIEFSK